MTEIMEAFFLKSQNGSMLIKTLREQHQKILQMLDRPELAEELIHFVEKEHHPLEEEELFPFLKDKKCLSAGGPKCSFFMGIRLEYDPVKSMKQNLQRLYKKTSFRPTPYPALPWLSPQSPLSIPFEEHEAGAELAQSLLFLLQAENKELHNEFFASLYKDYCRLLRLHIDKEDNCLFVIAEQAEREAKTLA